MMCIRCMVMCMRTNIVLNDQLVDQALKYSHARSKRAVVEEALQTYVDMKEQEMKRESYAERLARMRRKLSKVRLEESSQETVRRDRERTS